MNDVIRTKEDVNLLYLKSRTELLNTIYSFNIEWNQEVRQAMLDLGDPRVAYKCAFRFQRYCIDFKKIACKEPWAAFCYALDIDEEPMQDTWNAVKGSDFELRYINYFKFQYPNFAWER